MKTIFQVNILLVMASVLLFSCASTSEKTLTSKTVQNSPPEGYVFADITDNMDFTENGEFPSLLDDKAWTQIEKDKKLTNKTKRKVKPKTLVAYKPVKKNVIKQPIKEINTPTREAIKPVIKQKNTWIASKPIPKMKSYSLLPKTNNNRIISQRPEPRIIKASLQNPPRQSRPAIVQKSTQKIVGVRNQIHIVQKGDSLWGISKKYNIPMQQIQSLNRLPNQNVRLGQKLIVPNKGNFTPSRNASKPVYQASINRPQASKLPQPRASHRVRPGETLWRVSKNYRVSVDQLRKLNRLNNDQLRIGQLLLIP